MYRNIESQIEQLTRQVAEQAENVRFTAADDASRSGAGHRTGERRFPG